jgi:hypothetical protein
MEQHCKASGGCSSLPVRVARDELSSQCRANENITVRSVQSEGDVTTATACLGRGERRLRLSWGKMRDP